MEESREIRKNKADLIVPSRWVRTNKNDGLIGKDFLAKSRLVVQGFKDKALGQYRRDAPTASAIAESICLAVCAFYRVVPPSYKLSCNLFKLFYNLSILCYNFAKSCCRYN